MSDFYYITILEGSDDGSLELSDRTHTRATRNSFIVWTVADESNVASIEDITITSGSSIFSQLPRQQKDGSWRAKIKNKVYDDEWSKYNIHWKDKQGTVRQCDPLITIRPSSFARVAEVALVAGVAIAAFVAFDLLFSKGHRRMY